MWDFVFFLNSVLLGLGLAMDAFSASVANGLKEPCMKKSKVLSVAGIFGFFQTIMPLIGWFLVHSLVEQFKVFEPFIPWIALALLTYIGVKMIIDSVKCDCVDCDCKKTTFLMLITQGIATSIDALSVGFTIAGHDLIHALVSTLIIGLVTFILCTGGVIIGKKFGNKLSGKATLVGGIILILIGLEIFITSFI